MAELIKAALTALLNADEAADFLNLTRPALYGAVQRREIPHVRMGKRRLRFRRADLEAYLEARAVAPAPPVDLRRRGGK